jgi:hypothetical protein
VWCSLWGTDWILKYYLDEFQLQMVDLVARWVLVTDKHFACIEIMLPVGVLSYSALPCRDMRFYMLHEQERRISMRSNDVWEWTRFLLVNTPRLHLHSFCSTWLSSGLATSRLWLECHEHGNGPALSFVFCIFTWYVRVLILNTFTAKIDHGRSIKLCLKLPASTAWQWMCSAIFSNTV